MKIPVSFLKKKYLYIEPHYKSDKIIIPIGCDCHPANMLKKLHLRKQSLPFDWLNTQPEEAISYILENVESNFSKCFKNLRHNERGKAISENFPKTEFFHEPKIIDDIEVQNKFIRRARRFQELIYSQDVYYLCNIKVEIYKNDLFIKKFIKDVKLFSMNLKANDTLHIYFTSDEDTLENRNAQIKLCESLANIKKVKTTTYCKNFTKYGILGSYKDYPILLYNLGIKAKRCLIPKFFFKR